MLVVEKKKHMQTEKVEIVLSASGPSTDNNNQPLDLNSLHQPLCRCSDSTGRGVRRGQRRQKVPGVLETTWNRRRNHSCPRRSTVGGCSAKQEGRSGFRLTSYLTFMSQSVGVAGQETKQK